jgi:A/G-specific adenine glycosylase
MLQQTRMEVVLDGYYDRFLQRFPDVASLARASEDEVMAMWSGLGYYRRARMLRAGAIDVMERFGGLVPARVDELLTISGIGRYTAGAIASIAHGRRAAIVDGNVARIVARIEGIEAPLGSPALMREAWSRAEELVAACSNPRNFNQGLMEVGALICRPARPLCMLCPVQRACVAFTTGRTDELPVAKEKKATRELLIPLYLILDRDGRILMRRESGKLMSSMFHLPHGNSSLLGGTPLEVAGSLLLGTFRHTVTTRRIEFALYQAELPRLVRDDDGYAWIDPHRLDDYPHPSYVRKALRLARAKSAL